MSAGGQWGPRLLMKLQLSRYLRGTGGMATRATSWINAISPIPARKTPTVRRTTRGCMASESLRRSRFSTVRAANHDPPTPSGPSQIAAGTREALPLAEPAIASRPHWIATKRMRKPMAPTANPGRKKLLPMLRARTSNRHAKPTIPAAATTSPATNVANTPILPKPLPGPTRAPIPLRFAFVLPISFEA